ncbi:uncharacterized protein BT62DRAFT_900310 [Guyanagaster necrorhizus]|uniref:Uncharacterized protein n=1 Tax=Guyanagaster necrorhizus TaxID=856835 RepID=A0A9P8AQX4_9AGAR|nr:uncharacterized protein BT62DRAFT_900310 [Guyanagaster necrorhizus MCA 3950]KAG7444470.1 hypothetical protein BT62DRAFT_900310 [Guyanagaster necrorhizus MCA 3950]
MTEYELRVLDTIESKEYISTDLLELEIDIPDHMLPPNPDEHDKLPSHTHPSYPYGNPTRLSHPAAQQRVIHDATARSVLLGMSTPGGGMDALKWKELALSELLPIDEAKEEAEQASEARKMASGASANNPPPQYEQTPMIVAAGPPEEEEDEEDEEDEEEDDEDEEEVEGGEEEENEEEETDEEEE